MGSIKKLFGVAAMTVGSAGAVWGGLGLATGGWSSSGSGGVDLTNLGVVFTLAAAGAAYAGYKAVTRDLQQTSGITVSLKSSLKKVFGSAALGFGAVGTLTGGLALLTGGWSTAGAPGGVDLTGFGLVVTALSAGVAWLGLRACVGEGPELFESDKPAEAPPTDNKPK